MEKVVKKKRKRRRRKKVDRKLQLRVRIMSFCMICAAIAGVAIWYFGSATVSLAAMTKISLVGYDSKGWVKAEMDGSSVQEEEPQIQQVLDTVEISFSKEENLSNGEQIEIQYSYDEELAKELGIRIKEAKTTFTVENLPQAEVISEEELFADVSLVYEGISPALTVQVVNNSTHPYIKTMDFVITNEQEYYAKGDTITIEAIFDEKEAVDYQYKVEKGNNGYCKTYAVENVDSYLTSSDQITEEMLNTLIDKGTECFVDANQYGLRIFSEANCMPIWIGKKTTFEWRNPYVISAYFNSARENAVATAGEYINDVKIVYGVTLIQADGVCCDAEIVVRYNGLMEKADGTIDLALDSGSMISASHKDKFIKDIVHNTYSEDSFESVKIL